MNYQINFGALSINQVVSAYLAWQSFATTAPKELAMAAVLGASGRTVSLTFSGNYYGLNSQFQSVISPLMISLPNGASLSSNPLGWIAGLEALAGGAGSLSTAQPDIVRSCFRFLNDMLTSRTA